MSRGRHKPPEEVLEAITIIKRIWSGRACSEGLEHAHQRARAPLEESSVLMRLVNHKNANRFSPNFLSVHLRPGAQAEQGEVWHLLSIRELTCTATGSRHIPFSRVCEQLCPRSCGSLKAHKSRCACRVLLLLQYLTFVRTAM